MFERPRNGSVTEIIVQFRGEEFVSFCLLDSEV